MTSLSGQILNKKKLRTGKLAPLHRLYITQARLKEQSQEEASQCNSFPELLTPILLKQ